MPEGWRPARDWIPPGEHFIDVWRLDLTVLEEDSDLLSPDESERASAHRFFSVEESVALEELTESERPAAFYRAWTRKEAYLKALGTGMTFPSNAFTIEFATEGPGQLVATEMPGDDPAVWRFADVELGSDFVGAICFEGPECPIRWWEA